MTELELKKLLEENRLSHEKLFSMWDTVIEQEKKLAEINLQILAQFIKISNALGGNNDRN